MKNSYLIIILLQCIFSVHIHAQNKFIDKIEILSNKCLGGNKKACNEIIEIAKNDKDSYLRTLATSKLTDQALLEEIEITDKDELVRKTAIEKLTNQVLLKEIATHDKNPFLRIAATTNITDHVLVQAVLKDLVLNFNYYDDPYASGDMFRQVAIKSIADQSILKLVAATDTFSDELRMEAISRLMDQSILKDIAINEKKVKVQKAAIEKLEDKTLITRGLDYFKYNPALKTQLIKWEQESPDSVKNEINHLRTGGSVGMAYASNNLGSMGIHAKGAILALIETLTNTSELMVINGSYGYTSPARCAVYALINIGKPAIEPLCYILFNESFTIRENASFALYEIGRNVPLNDIDPSLKKIIITAYEDNKDNEIHRYLELIIQKF